MRGCWRCSFSAWRFRSGARPRRCGNLRRSRCRTSPWRPGSRQGPGRRSMRRKDVAQIAAAAALVLAAIQNIANSRSGARAVVAAFFGAAAGVLLGSDVREAWPLAGSHAVAALSVFLVVVEVGCAALLVVMQPLLRMPFRGVRPPGCRSPRFRPCPRTRRCMPALCGDGRPRPGPGSRRWADATCRERLAGADAGRSLLALLVLARLDRRSAWSSNARLCLMNRSLIRGASVETALGRSTGQERFRVLGARRRGRPPARGLFRPAIVGDRERHGCCRIRCWPAIW